MDQSSMALTEELRTRAKSYRSGGPSSEHAAELLDRAAHEIEKSRIEIIQLKFACGYPMPSYLEQYILPDNPFKCGMCDAERRGNAMKEIDRMRAALAECLEYIEDDEVAHGRTFRAGRAARALLNKLPPGELFECVD